MILAADLIAAVTTRVPTNRHSVAIIHPRITTTSPAIQPAATRNRGRTVLRNRARIQRRVPIQRQIEVTRRQAAAAAMAVVLAAAPTVVVEVLTTAAGLLLAIATAVVVVARIAVVEEAEALVAVQAAEIPAMVADLHGATTKNKIFVAKIARQKFSAHARSSRSWAFSLARLEFGPATLSLRACFL